MKIIVCDDEPEVRQQIQALIKIRYSDAEVILKQSGQQVVENPAADLILLDIQMDDMNGIEVARKIRGNGIDTPIIFVTALKDYIYDAFDLDAFWYLLKPIEREKLYHVLDKATSILANNSSSKEDVLLIETKKRKYSISAKDILYVESLGKKCFLRLPNQVIEIYSSLRDLEERLGDKFYRCHRGYLVNMERICSYSGESIVVSNGDNVYIARDRYRDFVDNYMKFLERGV